MNIKYLERKDIDTELWNSRIEEAENGRPYAYSWYLDAVTEGSWAALVSVDYKRVMPLPFNKKLFGMRQVYQPVLSQQLGVFGNDISSGEVERFVGQIPGIYRYIHLTLNHKNQAQGKPRTNLVLDLSNDVSTLQSQFSSSLRKNLRKCDMYRLEETGDVCQTVDLYQKELESKVGLGSKNYQLIQGVLRVAVDRKKAKIFTVYRDNEVAGSGAFLTSHNRVINVFGASKPNSQFPHAMAFLLSEVIKLHSSKSLIFDFEGSDIPGVRSFFQSFGPVQENYTEIEVNRLPFWLAWYRR